MPAPRDTLRRQRRRELDARRSKSRVRLGASLRNWGQLKERLGFALHSELAQYLLQSYFSKVCVKCSGGWGEAKGAGPFVTSAESLQCLVLQVHCHGQSCPFPPSLQPASTKEGQAAGEVLAEVEGEGRSNRGKEEKRGGTDVLLGMGPTEGRGYSGEGVESELCLLYACQAGHLFTWCPSGTRRCGVDGGQAEVDAVPAHAIPSRERGRGEPSEEKRESSREEECFSAKTRMCGKTGSGEATEGSGHAEEEEEEEETVIDMRTAETGESKTQGGICIQEVESEAEGERVTTELLQQQNDCDSTVIQQKTTRGKQRKAVQSGQSRSSPRISKKEDKRGAPKRLGDDDTSQISSKRKRKVTPRDILPCEFDGCGKIFSSRQYLNHHMKYQHFQQKTFSCSHPSCKKSFNFKKHLKEHEKLHSNQRDYICEFCARAFRTSSNLIIHRRIHTGEKPLQCEVCGFTCRQKASLNWHMRKHDAESGYQFPCEICGRRFEKRDNVTAHRSKSHPDHTPSPTPATNPAALISEAPSPLPERPALALNAPTDPTHSADVTGQSSDLSTMVM